MKLLDKLKNALFEEEYVEVEEKPKRKPIKVEKQVKKQKEEKPIAKKIVLPERKEIKITNHVEEEEEIEIPTVEEEKVEKKEYKFPMISDNEFEPIVKEEIEEKFERPVINEIIEEKPIIREYRDEYREPKNKTKLYGMEEIPIPEPEYGTYEKKEDRTYFRPSPIISPIYGILDKNYKKEDVVQKREIRLSSAHENLDFDEVRRKAYGNLSDEIEDQIKVTDIEDEGNFMDQDLLDLSTEESAPEIKKVTVGDAEEYFSDLGLEYNVDYKDSATAQTTPVVKETTSKVGRRSEKVVEPELTIEPIIEEEEPVIVEEKSTVIVSEGTNDDIDDDNLFDLIDSMYDKE